MMQKRALHDGWSLSCNDTGHAKPPLPPTIPAAVPGCVHLDLLANRLIPDPYTDVNEIALDWIGRNEWVYRTRFAAEPDPENCQELVFEGLDTVAIIELNGAEIGRTFNMHRTYRFDVS